MSIIFLEGIGKTRSLWYDKAKRKGLDITNSREKNMSNSSLQNKTRVNHRGFLPNSQKRFILTQNDSSCESFFVFLVDNVEEIKVFEGKF